MWLHESESNSIITEAYENKIFLTIIYISYNSPSRELILSMLRIAPSNSSEPTYKLLLLS